MFFSMETQDMTTRQIKDYLVLGCYVYLINIYSLAFSLHIRYKEHLFAPKNLTPQVFDVITSIQKKFQIVISVDD